MSTKVRRWVLLCAVIGLAAASTSLYIHYRLLTQPGYMSPCDINATFSCSDAYRSQYGSLLGIPVALFGVLWFAFVIVLAAVASRGPAPVQESLPGYLFAWSTIGLAVTLYLAYAAFFVLKELCVFCLVTYAAVIPLFCLTGTATAIPMTTLPRRFLRDLRVLVTRPAALVVAILFLAASASAIAFFPRTGASPAEQPPAKPLTQDERSDFERFWVSRPREIVPVSSDGAAVLIVKFTDYCCPACGSSYFMMQPILAKYQAEMPGAVKLVSRDYPLDQSCNPALSQTLHPAGCAAAVAVRLADQHHRRAEMEQWLSSNQPGLTRAIVRDAARTVAGVTDFDQQYDKTIEAVKADITLGQQLQITSTPTFFVNGIRVPFRATGQGLQPSGWEEAIRLELKRAGQAK
jgi:uncharacterized membrane protein/predicted DsbA family dithiol-disulfide isomerase